MPVWPGLSWFDPTMPARAIDIYTFPAHVFLGAVGPVGWLRPVRARAGVVRGVLA